VTEREKETEIDREIKRERENGREEARAKDSGSAIEREREFRESES
jgi:hypothetical protein